MSLILGELIACQYSRLSSLFSDSQASELGNLSSSEFQFTWKIASPQFSQGLQSQAICFLATLFIKLHVFSLL